MRIPVPSIEEQRKIVHDYKVIADRIELLKKINVNLEKQAQVLYKSWFVDFDPFGNNLPSNWSEVCISDIASDVVCGKTPSTDDESNFGGKYPFITIPDMHDSVAYGCNKYYRLDRYSCNCSYSNNHFCC